ncbi:HAD family hydrolase [Deinococcus terrestris]|uniref:HAD family hydrolase n=1 Tax=Deinococcus terrestris TaxID=2651870 RepID=UPI00188421C8|nr:HAD family hydrolase [Deinococcus terrestris]
MVFDLDDTLLPEWKYVRSAYRAVAQSLFGQTSQAREAERWLWDRFVGGQHAGSLNALLEWSGRDEPVDVLLDIYRSHTPQVRLAPNVLRTLQELRTSGLRIGLISDGPLMTQRRKVEALGLGQLIDEICLTDVWGREYWKPHDRAYRNLESLWHLGGPQLAYVGDNLTKDFVAANALGWRTVCLRSRRQVHAARRAGPGGRPEVRVTSWKALDVLLQNWSRGEDGGPAGPDRGR